MAEETRSLKIQRLIIRFEKENDNDSIALNSITYGGDIACIVIGAILTFSPLLIIGIPLLISGIVGKNKLHAHASEIRRRIAIRNEKIAILKEELLKTQLY